MILCSSVSVNLKLWACQCDQRIVRAVTLTAPKRTFRGKKYFGNKNWFGYLIFKESVERHGKLKDHRTFSPKSINLNLCGLLMKATGFSYHKTDCGYLQGEVPKIESCKMLLATSKQGEGFRNFGCCHYIGFAYHVKLLTLEANSCYTCKISPLHSM